MVPACWPCSCGESTMTGSETPTAGAVVLVSGGMDSASAVYEAIDRGYDPYFSIHRTASKL